eukprot:4207323-Pyramimonas_sp.AAC.1
METWREFNAGYEIRFYDDAACRLFVATEFPGMHTICTLNHNERAPSPLHVVIRLTLGICSHPS